MTSENPGILHASRSRPEAVLVPLGPCDTHHHPMTLQDELVRTLGGSYDIERELGGGGMGCVFLATERRLGRKVVIKTIAAEQLAELSSSRFEREMMFAASLQHPHIVPVLNAGVAGGDVPYYTMPFVEGSTLRARLDAGRLPIADVVRILTHLATAMSYAHSKSIVHRDIKPENILLSDGIAVVTDFGVAKALSAGQPSGSTLTAAGVGIGTPAYMAPEQATGDPSSDERVDIYAFGIVAYEMLAGRRPFEHASTHRLIAAHLTQPVPPILSARPDTPAPLAALVTQCLEKDPATRPRSAAALLPVLNESAAATGKSAGNRRLIPLVLVASLLIAVAAVWTLSRSRAERAAPRAATPALPPAVAVLPFENVARDTASEVISDGMTDEVLSTLLRVPVLRVASRATTFSYKGKRDDPRAVAASLGVDALLTGSVRRDGEVVMLSVQLVSGTTGLPVWSQSYQRPVQDLYQVQSDIARSIASALRVTLAPGVMPTTQATKDAVAFDLYLQGRALLRRAGNDSATLEQAVDRFRRAITRDPEFALPQAHLARTYVGLADHIPATVVYPKAKAAAQRAVQLDPTLTDAGLALANIRLNFDWDWEGAENEYRRILALDSTSVAARVAYASFLHAARRFDEALIETEVANRLERRQSIDTARVSVVAARRLAWALIPSRRFAEADSLLRWALARDSSWAVRWQAGLAYIDMKQPAEAVRLLELVRARRAEELPYLSHLGVAYGVSGRADSARAIISRLERRMNKEYVPKDQLSALYLSVGDTAAALRYLRLAVDEHHFWLPILNGRPMFDSLRGNPEFQRLMRRVGAPER